MMKKKWIWIGIFSLCAYLVGHFYVTSAPSTLGKSQTLEIRDYQSDAYLYTSHYDEYVSYISLQEVSPYFLDCLISSEDKKFDSHHGIDWKRILSSIWQNFKKGEIVSGASTITQQLARTLYLSQEQTLKRKIKEARIALNLEKKYSKEQILEAYVNCAFFGHNLYGVEAASAYFFHKKASELDLAESSLLVGILSAPNIYSPDIDFDKAKMRQLHVLNQVFKDKKISEEDKEQAYAQELVIYSDIPSKLSSLPFYHSGMIYQMEKEKIITDTRDLHGYIVHSYLDMDIQNQIEKIISNKQLEEKEEISVVVMKPYSSHVLALVGGKDYDTSSYNRALFSSRQVGSTIKPLLYYLALCYGFSPLTTFYSEPTTFYIDGVGAYSPSNATNTYANKEITLLEAIALSDNIYATKTNLFLGSNQLESLLSRFGVSAKCGPTSGLGTDEMTPLKLCSIYNAFASEGDYYEPSFFSKVSLTDGTLLYKNEVVKSFSLNQKQVKILSYLLRSPFDRYFRSYATPTLLYYKPSHTFAAKSGSTESDSYVVGYNPRYTILVHIGTDDNSKIKNGNLTKEIFLEIANSLSDKYVDEFYEMNEKYYTPFHFESQGKKSFTYYKLA